MTRTPSEYERVVARLAKSIVAAVDSDPHVEVRYGRANKWRGQSGYNHQIDVSAVSSSGVLLVECKDWSRRISVEHVLAFAGRVQDLSAGAAGDLVRGSERRLVGVMATRAGLQEGAEAIARHFGVDLATVRSEKEFAFKYKSVIQLGLHVGGTSTASVSFSVHRG